MGGSAWISVAPVNMENVQTDTVGDDDFSPGDGCRVPLDRQNYEDMTYWDDSDSSEDCGYDQPGEFDFCDPRDYEEEWERDFAEEWEWNFAEESEGDWLADGLHEDGEFVYFKDAFGPKLAPVALSMEEGAAGQIMFSTWELPDGHGDVAIRDVPAVFGTGICATGGSDRTMAVFSPDSYNCSCMTVHPLGLPPLKWASVAHPEDISVRLERTVSVWTRGIPERLSPLVAVGRPGGTLPTSAFDVDSPDSWILAIRGFTRILGYG